MKMRRVATGNDANGKSVVASDEQVEAVEVSLAPGMYFHRLWGTDEPAVVPNDGSTPIQTSYFPPETGARFIAFTVPPDSAAAPAQLDDMEAAVSEAEKKLPGMLQHLEMDDPGFHTTDTTDYLYVASGRVIARLDNGVEVELKAGDTFVQNGTRHAWRNPGDEPTTLVGVIVGANRKR